MTLEIRLFGCLLLQHNGTPLESIRSRTARSLFAYLVTHADRAHTREQLIRIFWPNQTEVKARRRLSHTLWEINSVLRDVEEATPYILTDAETVQFDPRANFWLDVVDFETKLAQGGLEGLMATVDLYRGDFLEGYHDYWILPERERLRERYLAALDELVTAQKAAGHYGDALVSALRLVDADPLREEAWREVMRLCTLLDRPQEALQRYEQCSDGLKEELGVEPSLATVELAQRIAAVLQGTWRFTPPEETPASPPEHPFIGRRQERATLVRTMERILVGTGDIVLVEGVPGIGKTRLLQQIGEDALWRGMQVLWGCCREHGDEPYTALRQALSEGISPLRAAQLAQRLEPVWLRQASRLLPMLARWLPELPPHIDLQGTDQQRRLWESLSRLLLTLTELSPLLLIVDDVHWADEGTLEALAHLAPRLRQARLLMVLSYRTEEAQNRSLVWETLRAVDAESGQARVQLAPLDPEATAQLVQADLGERQEAPHFAARLHKEIGGNPLFVLETLRHLREEGLLFQDENGSTSSPRDVHELPLSPVLRRLIDERLARLQPLDRHVAEAAAVLGNHVGFGLLARAAGLEGGAVTRAVQSLTYRGLLIEGKTGYDWRHDLLRQTTYQAIPARRLWELHRRAGYALETEQSEQVAALARHFTLGEVWPKAVQYHLQAGEQAAHVYAHHTALAAYEQTLAILDEHAPLPEDKAQEIRYQIFRKRHNLFWMQGRWAEQEADIRALVATARALADPRRIAEALNQQAIALYSQHRLVESLEAAEEAFSISCEHGLYDQAALALTYRGDAYYRLGEYITAQEVLEQALAFWEMHAQLEGKMAATHARLALVFKRTGRYDEAESALDQVLTIAAAAHDQFWEAIARCEMTAVAISRGHHQRGIELGQAALQALRAIGFEINEPTVLGNLFSAYLALGEYGEATACVQQSLQRYRRQENRRGITVSLSDLADLYEATGRYVDAERALWEGLAQAREIEYPYAIGLHLLGISRICRIQDRRAEGEDLLAEARQVADRSQIPDLRGSVHLVRGLYARDCEDFATAERAFATAEDIFQASDLSDGATAAQSHRASTLWRQEHHAEARTLSAQAFVQAQQRQSASTLPAVYLNHWQILAGAGETESAQQVLDTIVDHLHKQAERLPDQAWRRTFWENVPEHRTLLAAWQALQPQGITMQLPHVDAPIGRPLHADEWVTVTWMVDALDDEAVKGKKRRRQHRILRLLREAAGQEAAPRVEDLAQVLDVTPKTIKRDLAQLRQAGHEVLTRGSRS